MFLKFWLFPCCLKWAKIKDSIPSNITSEIDCKDSTERGFPPWHSTWRLLIWSHHTKQCLSQILFCYTQKLSFTNSGAHFSSLIGRSWECLDELFTRVVGDCLWEVQYILHPRQWVFWVVFAMRKGSCFCYSQGNMASQIWAIVSQDLESSCKVETGLACHLLHSRKRVGFNKWRKVRPDYWDDHFSLKTVKRLLRKKFDMKSHFLGMEFSMNCYPSDFYIE